MDDATPDRPAEGGRPASGGPAWWTGRVRVALVVLFTGVAVYLGLWLWLGWSQPAAQEAAGYSESDAIFATVMIEHHAQAIEVAALASGRTQDTEILALTEAVTSSSIEQVQALSAWLRERGLTVPVDAAAALAIAAGETPAGADGGSGPRLPDGAGHAHGEGYPQHGMLAPEQIDVIASLEGTVFELHLLDGLIRHHEGALQLAKDEVYAGQDAEAVALAHAEQELTEAELATLRELLGPKMVAKS